MKGMTIEYIMPRLYKEVKWYALIEKVTGADTIENRLSLYDWVNLPSKQDENYTYYQTIREYIMSYFRGIKKIFLDEDRDGYHWRVQVIIPPK